MIWFNALIAFDLSRTAAWRVLCDEYGVGIAKSNEGECAGDRGNFLVTQKGVCDQRFARN